MPLHNIKLCVGRHLVAFSPQLLAVPLSRVNPRQGKFGKLLPALALFLGYYILLIVCRNLIENEKVQIVNNNNGERFETYAIKGERGSGMICLNGATARKVQLGDILIIMSYGSLPIDEAKKYQPILIFPDDNNKLLK